MSNETVTKESINNAQTLVGLVDQLIERFSTLEETAQKKCKPD